MSAERTLAWVILAMTGVLPACSPAEDSNPSTTDADALQQTTPPSTQQQPIPPIHVELIEESLEAGVNRRREAYQSLLQACNEAGFPTTPLSPAQVEKLGTARVGLWFAEDVQMLSRQSWNFRKDGTESQACNFALTGGGLHSRIGPDATVETDLETGESSQSPTEPGRLQRTSAQDDGGAVMEALGFAGPVESMVAGQPCAQWTAGDGATVCLWSGGRAWGFTDTINASGCSPSPLSTYESSIVVAQAPSSEGTGCKVTVQRFTVGTAFDEAGLAPPSATSGEAR